MRVQRIGARSSKVVINEDLLGIAANDGRLYMAKIGIVSSIDFQNTAQQTAFAAGVTNAAGGGATPTYVPKDRLGFDRKRIAAAIATLASDATVSCIVTVGGLIACDEAIVNSGAKSFISLIGWLPPAPFPQPSAALPGGAISSFKGCVTLNTSGLTQARVSWITAAPWATAVANIGLLYDKTTPMATQEINAFQTALGLAQLGANQVVDASNGRANPSQYNADFGNFAKTIASVIISAAPLHHQNREQLISAANASGLNICYPLQSYQNTGGTNQPVHSQAVAIGPDLDATPANPLGAPINGNGAYYLLGQMAWTVDNAPTAALGTPVVTAPTLTTAI
jgi:hypothetical protein